jgi:hypothetical protein
LSTFPKQNLKVAFRMLEEILDFRGQEKIHCFQKIFMEGEFITINSKLVKIILSQVDASNFI